MMILGYFILADSDAHKMFIGVPADFTLLTALPIEALTAVGDLESRTIEFEYSSIVYNDLVRAIITIYGDCDDIDDDSVYDFYFNCYSQIIIDGNAEYFISEQSVD